MAHNAIFLLVEAVREALRRLEDDPFPRPQLVCLRGCNFIPGKAL